MVEKKKIVALCFKNVVFNESCIRNRLQWAGANINDEDTQSN